MADDNVSPESHAALTGNNNKLELIREFVNRYEQKYWPLTAATSRDPRLDTIFNMLKQSALGYYEAPTPGNSFAKGVAIAFGTEPYVGEAGSSDDIETGLNADAAITSENKINVRCYILTDARSLVASPPIEDLVIELSAWTRGAFGPTTAPPPLIASLPLFTYEADKGQISQAPTLGDIVKIRSNSSDFLRGEIEGITKANIAYMMTLDPFDQTMRGDFDSAMAETIGDPAPACASPPGTPTHLPSQMHVSEAGKTFIWKKEGFRKWIYDDDSGNNTDYMKWTPSNTILPTPAHSRWMWSDYYVPKAHSADADNSTWRTQYKGSTGFGPGGVPTIGVGHAIKINAPGDTDEGSLALTPGQNERDFFMDNFKNFMGFTHERGQRQVASGGDIWSKKARFLDYRPDLGDDPGLTEALGKRLMGADVEAHCRYFKANITKPITQYQFDAMASYAFNTGPTGIGKNLRSLAKIVDQINLGNCNEAAEIFITSGEWAPLSAATPQEQHVLKRRKAEATLFATGKYSTGAKTPAFLIAALNEKREADTEIFLRNKGAKRKYVGKTAWFQNTAAYATWQDENQNVTVTVTDGEAKFEDIPPPATPTEEGTTQETIGSTTVT